MSIRELCDPSLTTMEWITVAISPNVLWFCPTFYTKLMSSITVADLSGMYSASAAPFCKWWASTPLLICLGKHSGVANAHSIGPSGCTEIALMFNCQLWAMTVILPKSDQSAFTVAAFSLIFTCFFLSIVVTILKALPHVTISSTIHRRRWFLTLRR